MTVRVRVSALRGLVDTHFAQRSYVATQTLSPQPGQIRHCGVTDLGGMQCRPAQPAGLLVWGSLISRSDVMGSPQTPQLGKAVTVE